MNEERTKRSLKAIFSADVKGYSRLMGQDEVGTVSRLKEYRQVMISHIERCGGRVVDSPGDNILVEFASVVDALECAVDVQKELKKHNDQLPSEKKMAFRIGINLGDVIEDGDRIYGDGVNVAARIEGLAEPGGICLSRTAFDAVGKKLPLGYAYIGEHEVKNIEKPVRVYRVLTEPEAAGKVIGEKRFLGRVSHRMAKGAAIIIAIVLAGLISWNIYLHQTRKVEAASLDKMAFPLPDKPSIAVLAFDNLSGDPNQDYISDGLAEEIITGLSKIPELFVISRNSSFTYKGKPVKVQQVSEELGVRYVLEGSVRKQDDRIRVTAQLIDAIKGFHIWSERYDREYKDILALQDDIMKNIMVEMQVKLTVGEEARYWLGDKSPDEINLKYHETVLRLKWNMGRGSKGFKEATRLAHELIKIDPEKSGGYAWAGWLHTLELLYGVSKSPIESMRLAEEYAQKALQLDENLGPTHGILGWLSFIRKDYDSAISEMGKWVALEPNGATAHLNLGHILLYNGSIEDAIQHLETAFRLDPYPSYEIFELLAMAYSNRKTITEPKDRERAIELCKKALEIQPDNYIAHRVLTAIYVDLNHMEDARYYASELRRIVPGISIKWLANRNPWREKERWYPYLEKMRKAGIPEE